MLYDAGIDALSFTVRADDPMSKWVTEMYDKYIQKDASTGNDLKEAGRSRFSGVGTKHLFMGGDGKHDLYEVKTGYADEVAQELKTKGVPIHATRMDFAVTYQMRKDREAYTLEMRRQVREAIKQPGQRLPGHSVLHENADGGNTLYIQTADKSLMHRTYNKAVRDPGLYPDDAYRHEEQYRGKRAVGAWNRFLQSPSSGWLARGYAMGFLLNYGIEEEWMLDTEPVPAPSKSSKSDTERRMQWLENTVMPVVSKVLDGGITHGALVRMLRKAGLNCVEEK
jgi:hypothetical protein